VDVAVGGRDRRVPGDEVHELDVRAVRGIEVAGRDLPDPGLHPLVLVEDQLGGPRRSGRGAGEAAGVGELRGHHVDAHGA
jgi:hypothetical protein